MAGMLKLVTFLTRRPGMSTAEFRAYYETHHRKIGEKVLAGYATHYVRRYLEPVAVVPGVAVPPAPCDVVMEIWFPDRGAFERFVASVSQPEVLAEIAADEERVFDRALIRSYFVEEHASTLPPAG
jgi:EthD domain